MNYLTSILLFIIIINFNLSSAADFEYQNLELNLNNKTQKIHIIIFNPDKYNLNIITPDLEQYPDNKTSLKNLAQQNPNTIAAINGSFFRETETGQLKFASALKINNTWLNLPSSTKPRAALGWDNNTPDTTVFGIIDKQSYLHKLWQKYPNIFSGAGLLIFNGKPIKIQELLEQEQLNQDFVLKPHARTVIGKLNNNFWFLLMSEYNSLFNSSNNNGFNLPELIDFLDNFNINTNYNLTVDMAINLDGGSSSAMYLNYNAENNHKIINGEIINRYIANSVAVTPK